MSGQVVSGAMRKKEINFQHLFWRLWQHLLILQRHLLIDPLLGTVGGFILFQCEPNRLMIWLIDTEIAH